MSITAALASRYPDLTSSQRERLEAEIYKWLAGAIERGEAIGSVDCLADGSVVVGRFTMEGDPR